MKVAIIKFLYIIILCFACFTLNAQDYFRKADIYDMRLLNQQSGLNNNTLTGIHQDKNGFMWLGTDVGLNRFDGIHFHTYDWMEEEPVAIGNIIEDSGRLWFRVEGQNQIACFDKTKGCYLPVVSDKPEMLADIKGITSAGGKLYVSTAKGMAVLEVVDATDCIRVELHLLPDTPSDIVCLRSDSNSVYALTAGRKLFIYQTDTCKKEYADCNELNIAPEIPIDDIYAFNGYVWICPRWSGGICYNPATGQSREVVYSYGKSGYNSTYIRDIAQIDANTFIVAARNALYTLTFESDDFVGADYHITDLSPHLERYAPALNNGITQIYYDKENAVLWVGTFGRGVLKLNMGRSPLQRISMGEEKKIIKAIMQDAGGYIWLSTEQSGIYRSVSNRVSTDMQFTRWEKADVHNNYCMYKDKNGSLWMGCMEGNVLCLNPSTGETVSYRPELENDESVGSILSIYLNTRGFLWIVSDKGVAVFDYKNNKVTHWMAYSEELAPVTAICEDGDGMMWLGTKKGLVTLRYIKGEAHIARGYEMDNDLKAGEVLALYVNNYNQIFASYVNKIIQIDGKGKKVVSTLLLKQDFANGHINCMMDDGNGNTWLGTNAGLMTINNNNSSTYNYSFPEHYYKVCLLNNGSLLWASSSGLAYFDPRQVKQGSVEQKLYLSDIDVNYKKIGIGEKMNGQVVLEKPFYQTEHLELNHRNNNLVIYLSDLRYGNASNRVEYRLLPQDEEWRTGSQNQITLSNLTHGDYRLEIRPVSPLDVDMAVTVLTISVGEYWAASNWAFLAYILTGIVLAFFIWQYIANKKMKRRLFLAEKEKLKQKLEEEKKKREEEEETNRMRDQVRLGLAKELRTPLSLIIAPLKEMLERDDLPRPLMQKAEIAYRSSMGIQDICNQLLSIYQHRNGDYQLKVAPYAVGELANSVVHSFYELLNSCPITLIYDKEDQFDTEIWVDYARVGFILKCIFSNAYRHISYAGSIWFTIHIVEVDNKKHCVFTVRDDGKSAAEESSVIYLSKVSFDIVDNHNELAVDVMREMAMAHHGEIIVERRKDEGTTVSLYIPLGKEHFEEDEGAVFVDPMHITLDKEEAASLDILLKVSAMPDEEVKPLQDSLVSDKKHTVLIIEDHLDIRTYLKILFSSSYNILLAENGAKGVELARKELPDLIITDVMMPEMDGFECCRILKENLNTCHIPIILLTALAEEEDMMKGIELGADEYMYKPFNPDILKLKVKRLIKSRIELKQAYAKRLLPSAIADADNGQDEPETIKAEDPFIEEILEIANKNLQNPSFSVKWLAEKLNMSQATLYRRIKQSTDFSLVELIRGVRLKRSAELLKTKKYSVQEVAEMVGYNDAPTFRKHFVDFYGTTPSAFVNKPSEG